MGSALVAANKKSLVLPPSPGWKESISDDANCQKTVSKSWQAAPHGRRRVSMARRPQTCHALSVPQYERASSARRETSSRSAYDGGRLLRAPVNGVRRRVRGPAAGPKPGLLADFHKTLKKHVAGIISELTALKIGTAWKRNARLRVSAVIRWMVRGPAAGPKPGLLADFHKT